MRLPCKLRSLRKGCSIIFINSNKQILLLLRHDTPGIPYPNLWDIPEGHVENSETPEQYIIRDMNEEMDLDSEWFHLFSIIEL